MDDADDGAHVRAPTLADLARICDSLNRSQARYLLIGGFAVIAHGGGRTTKDIDFLIDASPENTVVRVADEVLIDLLGSACGVSYEDAMADAEVREIERVPVPVASKQTLIRTKETVRPSDQIDRDFLAALIREEGEER